MNITQKPVKFVEKIKKASSVFSRFTKAGGAGANTLI